MFLLSNKIYLRNECDSWNEYNSICVNNSALQELVFDALIKDYTGSITKTLAGTDISQDHKRHPGLKVKHMRRKTIRF